MLYRVEFHIAYGGFYFSESFTDLRDVENLKKDILGTEGWMRFVGIEISEDCGETWEPFYVMETVK